MRTFKQYLEAAKARKENGEAGFSLVELIVVVVILGILAAVAIPIFNGIQKTAEENATQAAAANAAAQVTAEAAIGGALTTDLSNDNFEITIVGNPGQVDSICATATSLKTAGITRTSGPAC